MRCTKNLEINGNFKNKEELSDWLNDNTPIHRVMPVQFFYDMIKNNELILRRIDTWSDKNECIIRNIEYDNCDAPCNLFWYGLCWTKYGETEAMWKLFSHESGVVRISTTIGKLAKVFLDYFDSRYNSLCGVKYSEAYKVFSNRDLFIFDDIYYSDDLDADVKKKMAEISDDSINSSDEHMIMSIEKSISEFLLMKRNFYRHEEECRILIYADSIFDKHKRDSKKSLVIPFNDNFIDRVTFSPDSAEIINEALKTEFQKKLPSAVNIEKSVMYEKIILKY